MRGVVGRAVASAVAVVGLLGAPVGVASAGAGPAVLAFERYQYAYGLVSIGAKPERAFILVNSGDRASGALTVSLSASSAFTVAADTCTGTSLGPRKSCTVTVRFAPRAVGPASATLTAVGKNHVATASVELSGAGGGLGAGSDAIYWSMDDGFILAGTLGGQVTSVLVTSPNYANEPNQLVVVGDYLYWADTAMGTINRVPVTTGGDDNVDTLFSGQNQPTGIAVYGQSIYWTNTGDSATADGSVNTGPLTGGNSNARTLFSNQFQPMGLAVDGTNLYWANYGSNYADDGTINAAPLDGGSSRTLFGGLAQPYGVAVDGNSIYWTTWNWIFGQDSEPAGVYQAPLSGEFVTLLIGGQSLPAGLTVANDSVYWAVLGEQTIKQAPLSGEFSNVLFDMSGDLGAPRGVALPPNEFP